MYTFLIENFFKYIYVYKTNACDLFNIMEIFLAIMPYLDYFSILYYTMYSFSSLIDYLT